MTYWWQPPSSASYSTTTTLTPPLVTSVWTTLHGRKTWVEVRYGAAVTMTHVRTGISGAGSNFTEAREDLARAMLDYRDSLASEAALSPHLTELLDYLREVTP